jgi:hypothetical protein
MIGEVECCEPFQHLVDHFRAGIVANEGSLSFDQEGPLTGNRPVCSFGNRCSSSNFLKSTLACVLWPAFCLICF